MTDPVPLRPTASEGRFTRGLNSPSGSGTSGGMDDERLSRLEQSVAAIRSDIVAIGDKVKHLPTGPQAFWGGLGLVLVFTVSMIATVLGVGSYMSGTMSTALSAIQAAIAARPPEVPAQPQQPIVIVVPAPAPGQPVSVPAPPLVPPAPKAP